MRTTDEVRRALKAARIERGDSAATVSRRLGDDRKLVSRLETAEIRWPAVETLQRWADALDLRIDVVLSRKEDPDPSAPLTDRQQDALRRFLDVVRHLSDDDATFLIAFLRRMGPE
jgi:transcriptional regulator with XRE-family HTH domain